MKQDLNIHSYSDELLFLLLMIVGGFMALLIDFYAVTGSIIFGVGLV